MALITQGRQRTCKAFQGGVKAAYLAPYKKVQRSQIVYDKVTLTQFPQTLVYKFDLINGTVFEQKQSDGDGGKYFDIGLTLTFNKITAFDNVQFSKLLNKDYFMIVQDRNNNYFMLGFRNGLTANSIKTTTTQYTIDWEGMEEEFSPFVTGLIGDTFIIVDGEDYIFQDGTNFIFQDDTNYIFQ